ncbi:MAG: transposase, partial [SAR324 cluster bacterium]|nr:transposase [SAR324 cluster bacterium]
MTALHIELKKYCQSVGIEVVTINAHRPTENGKIERFHRTLKYNFFWRFCGFYDSEDELQYKLNQWVDWYNT